MYFALLDGMADAAAIASPVSVGLLREFPGGEGVSVHLQHPLGFERNEDGLYSSARSGSALAYKLLTGEGLVRAQLWVRFDLTGHFNVVGNSASLLFALALVMHKWVRLSGLYPSIAATGVVTEQGEIRAVAGIVAKLTALQAALSRSTDDVLAFYPRANHAEVSKWLSSVAAAPKIRFVPVGNIEEALEELGIRLLKTFLRNPFRGLESFEYEHRAIFFGREREVAALVDICLNRELLGCPAVIVIGASGSGKSSLLQAGLLPVLAEPALVKQSALRERRVPVDQYRAVWRPSMATPGNSEATLAASIWSCWNRLDEFRPALARIVMPDSLSDLLSIFDEYWDPARRCVWIIDQFEELFSPAMGNSAAILDSFGEFLCTLRARGVWVLASLRDDFLPQFTRHERLRKVFDGPDGCFYPPGMRGSSVDDVIVRPARASGLSFETDRATGRSLEAELKEEVRAQAMILPLLEFTLSELYSRRNDNLLTLAAYDSIGGLRGAITSVAEQVVGDGGFIDSGAFTRAFRCLVSVDLNGTVARRHASAEEFAADEEVKALIARMVEKRLCVAEAGRGALKYTLAHEALITLWSRVRDWLTQEQEVLQVRDQLQHDCDIWDGRARSKGLLAVSPEKIAHVRRVRSAMLMVEPTFAAFLTESEREFKRRQVARRFTVAGLVMLAIVSSAAALMARHQGNVAEQQRAIALSNESLRALAAGDLKDAVALSNDAQSAWHDSDGRPDPNAAYSFLRARAVREVSTTDGPGEPVATVVGYTEGSWDGSRIAFLQTNGRALVLDPGSNRFHSYAPAAGWAIQVQGWPNHRVAVFSNVGDLVVYDETTAASLPLHIDHAKQPQPTWRPPGGTTTDTVLCYSQRCVGLVQDDGDWHLYSWRPEGDTIVLEVLGIPGKLQLANYDFLAQGVAAFVTTSGQLFVYRLDSLPLERTQVIAFAPDMQPENEQSFVRRAAIDVAPVLSDVSDFEFVDDSSLVAVTKSHELVFVDLQSRRPSVIGVLPETPERLSVSYEGGRAFAVLANGEVFAADKQSLHALASLSGPVFRVYELAGTCLIVSVRFDGLIDVVDTCAKADVISWKAAEGVRSATFDSRTQTLFLVSYAGRVQQWDLSRLIPNRAHQTLADSAPIRWPFGKSGGSMELKRMPQAAMSAVPWSQAVPLLVDIDNDLVIVRDRTRVILKNGVDSYVLNGFSARSRAQRIDEREIAIFDERSVALLGVEHGVVRTQDAIVQRFPVSTTISRFKRDGRLLLAQGNEQLLLFDATMTASALLQTAIQANVEVTGVYLVNEMQTAVIETGDCTTRLIHVETGRLLSMFTRACAANLQSRIGALTRANR